MEGSDLVPYEPKQEPAVRYSVDFGRGPVSVVFGKQGIYVTPLVSHLDGSDIRTIAAVILFTMCELKQTNYDAFVHGINTIIFNLSQEDASELSLEEMAAASLKGSVSEDDLIEIGRTSREQLTADLKVLYRKFLGVDYRQLPLPLQFESEGRQLPLPLKFE
ncbi:hypothetical protein HYU20_01005 [Candidatus Woesearchaeota archaeon]|nr:hypothetical protein [Candidatus Woesearchaeota archaeon]